MNNSTLIYLKYSVFVVFLWSFSACSKQPDVWEGPKLTEPRNQLTAQALMHDSLQPYVDYSYYAMPQWAQQSAIEFQGELQLSETTLHYDINRAYYPGETTFPKVTIPFVSYNGMLLPTQTEFLLNAPGKPDSWNILVGPGKIWYEPTDSSWSRASFPLSLTDSYIGSVKNCVATFVFKSDSVSNVCVQCSQETADYNDGSVGNMRAILPATYQPKTVAEASQTIDAYLHSQQESLPVEPLSAIDAGNALQNYFNQTAYTATPTSLGALVLNNTLYMHPSTTRHGEYPYPLQMRHGVYSVSKTMAGALAVFYLAQRYGTEFLSEPITNYVSELAHLPEWQGVTFLQCLNMVTGTQGGEDASRMYNVMVAPKSSAAILANIAQLGDLEAQPGVQFHYATTNLFVLSAALQAYVVHQEGANTNYWNLVQQNVLQPLGIADFTVLKTVESDSLQALPLLGYGALPTAQHAAKIALLFANKGNYKGEQLLHAELCKQALQPDYWEGYSTNNDDRGATYKHSFWSTTQKVNGCKVEVSYMLGAGGNYIWIFPSNAIAIRFMDENDYHFNPLVKAVESIASSCE